MSAGCGTPAALFLDRDGTIIRDSGYLADPAGVELLPGAAAALRRAAAQCRLYLFSNQSGIGRGFYTLAEAEAVNARMVELLGLPPPGFAAVCLAPETPEEPAVYRKPSPRFILECLARDRLDAGRCWILGDKRSDLEAGVRAGIRAAWIWPADGRPAETRRYCETHDLPQFESLAHAVETLVDVRRLS